MTTIFNLIGPVAVWLITNVGPWAMFIIGIILISIWIGMIPGLWRDLSPRKQEATPDGLPVKFDQED